MTLIEKREPLDVVFEGVVTQLKTPRIFIDAVPFSVDTLDVSNCSRYITNNVGPTTINYFINGGNGQEIKILGDGFTSVSNTGNIKPNTGLTKLLQTGTVYTFTLFQGVWYEDE